MSGRMLALLLLAGTATLAVRVSAPLAAAQQPSTVTFNKDVFPILQKNCQVCHRPGQAAPMSFLTYESTRPWAKAIKNAVLSRKMPPWFAEATYASFRNAPRLIPPDVQTLVAWVDSGALEGDPEDKPAVAEYSDGWRIQPDVIVSMPEPHSVAAKGAGEIKAFMVPNPFREDTWVTSIEIRPGDPSVVHHVVVQVPEERFAGTASAWGALTPPFLPGSSTPRESLPVRSNGDGNRDGGYFGGRSEARQQEDLMGTFTTMEAVYVPGSPPMDFRFHSSAKLIPGGKPIRIEVHYTPNGKQTTDRTSIGFTLAKDPAQRRFVTMAPAALVNPTTFRIPAGAADWKAEGVLTFNQDVELVWFMPHMHLRGKDMTYRLIHPNGLEETVLSAKFNFDWQLGYEVEEPLKVRKGTKMVVTAHYDNSANNRFNPDSAKDVGWGELTSQEMLLPWFGVVVDHDASPEQIASYGPVRRPEAQRTPTLPAPGLTLPGRNSALPLPIPLPR